MTEPVELFVFSVCEDSVRAVSRGGAAGIIVDWERLGKAGRQQGYDTEINSHDEQDLANVRAWTDKRVICRIDRSHDWRLQRHQIDQVIDLGGDEILLPMVRSIKEPARVMDYLANRGAHAVGILVETRDAVALRHELAQLPLSRVYVGLNDLAIDSGGGTLFDPLADGSLADILAPFRMPVGFGGLTLADRGFPIPCRLLMGALLDLGAGFTFLRRSFFRDTTESNRAAAVREIRASLRDLAQADPEQRVSMHDELLRLLQDEEHRASMLPEAHAAA